MGPYLLIPFSRFNHFDQVEGTQNEEKEEQEDVGEEKDGLEMEDDFDGALGDVVGDEEQQDSEHEEQGLICSLNS